MAVNFKPNMEAYLCDGAITKGMAVKKGTDDSHVVKCSANTDKAIGIAQCDVTLAEQTVEVALMGGGAKAKLSEAVVAGAYLVPHTDGTLALPNAAGDHIIAFAMSAGAIGDLINVMVVCAEAYNAES